MQLIHPLRSLEPLPHVDWGNLKVRKNKFPRHFIQGTCSPAWPCSNHNAGPPHNHLLVCEKKDGKVTDVYCVGDDSSYRTLASRLLLQFWRVPRLMLRYIPCYCKYLLFSDLWPPLSSTKSATSFRFLRTFAKYLAERVTYGSVMLHANNLRS